LSLIEWLTRGEPCPIVSLVAPPGYGKTTLLSQWAERNGQSFAWVSVDEGGYWRSAPRIVADL
jgi:LuxR family transcriptional regulator, maltose regulon positive regulatory protein